MGISRLRFQDLKKITLPFTAIFLSWTFTSFMCHRSAKLFFDTGFGFLLKEYPSNDILCRILLATIVTAAQIALCFVTIEVSYTGSYLHIARATHILATFATNISMTMMYASSTFSIKLLEPITSATMQYLLLGTPLSPVALLSLPIIVGGAIGFARDPVIVPTETFGVVAAFTSNFILAYRNLALKQMRSGQDTAVSLKRSLMTNSRSAYMVMGFVVLVLLVLQLDGELSTDELFATLMLVATSTFHVMYSYVSTGLVLKQLSVVSHAVANIVRRILVVLMLYAFGNRMASPANWVGLTVCVAGLILYTWDKLRQQRKTEHASAKEPLKSSAQQKKCGGCFRALGLSVAISLCLAVFFLSPLDLPSQGFKFHLFDNPKNPQNLVLNHVGSGQTFGASGYIKPQELELQPNLSGYLNNESAAIRTFLQKRLIDTPERANFLSEKLRTHEEIIREAQRLHFNIIGDALKKYKYSMLFDIAAFENKGDPAISVGEFLFLARINLPVVFTCKATSCGPKVLNKARAIAQNYTTEELVILIHGGGNIIGYAFSDISRFDIMDTFRGYDLFVFPQSVWVRQVKHPHVDRCRRQYCCNENLTLVLRDLTSYHFAKEYFSGSTRLLMAPDMAFQIGNVYRTMPPVFDIMWIKRKDGETPGYTSISNHPSDIRVHVADWWQWRTPWAPFSIEQATYITANGMFFLQRGRVVVSDRLHGHILATLMNIPHVLIDNTFKKLSSYHNTWTRSLENTLLTDDPNLGVKLSMALLKKYRRELPPRIIYPQLSESFTDYNFEKLEFNSYP